MYTPIEVVEHVLRLLQEGNRVSTYKNAVLLALIDLSLEQSIPRPDDRISIKTRDITEKVISYYWDQTLLFADRNEMSARVLRQIAPGPASNASIIKSIRDFRERRGSDGVSLRAARLADRAGYIKLCNEVEWTLIAMPLPKLQRVGRANDDILYSIRWRDDHKNQNDTKPKAQRSEVAQYQAVASRTAVDVYDSVELLPGVGSAFASLHALLRPHIIQHWISDVVSWNGLEHSDTRSDVSGFLFSDFQRVSLAPVREVLIDFDLRSCFYCCRNLTGDVEIDHFIPWSRTHDDGLHNLVTSCRACNQDKLDYFGSHSHLKKWLDRMNGRRRELESLSARIQWEFHPQKAIARAANIYSKMPHNILVWDGMGEFIPLDLMRVRELLVY
jgi:5-methylcytosine-specific restriction endonuclease McrA